MDKINPIIFLYFLAFICSCDESVKPDNNFENVNCDNLRVGIVNIESGLVKAEIDKLTNDLTPKVTTSDKFGHKENVAILINRLNSLCNIEAELICYACIKTNPPQSEIFVNADSSGTQIRRVIDLWTSDESNLRFARIHD